MRAFRSSRSALPSVGGHLHAQTSSSTRSLRATALAVIAACGLASAAQADTLASLYEAAKNYDAAYLSAKAQAESYRYQVDGAQALNRPTVGLNGELRRNLYDSGVGLTQAQEAANLAAAQAGQQAPHLNNNVYSTTKTVSVGAKYPLYNPVNDAKVSQAELQLQNAVADMQLAENDLMARLAGAYFDVLGAQGNLELSTANKKAMAETLASAKRNFEVGNATVTDQRQAQARYDQADAAEIAATNDLKLRQMLLEQLVGRSGVQPNLLKPNADLSKLSEGSLEDWLSKAPTSPGVRKAELGLEGTKFELEKSRAGHMPTVDLGVTAIRSLVDSNNSGFNINSGSGITYLANATLNVPLYAGGAVENRIKEVIKLQEKAESDRDRAARQVDTQTRGVYTLVQSGLAQIKALETASGSAKVALEATQLGYRVGVNVNKDVLDAQTLVTTVGKDLAKARYDVIVNSVRLRAASGNMRYEDLQMLDEMLVR